jgi:hypothetical protein
LPPPTGGADLVRIVGIPVDPQTSDPRLRQCMLSRVNNVYNLFMESMIRNRMTGVELWITSANRPGASVGASTTESAHSRGEAVDFVIRPKPADWNTNPTFLKQLDLLIDAGIRSGFTPLAGDTLDEYRRPTTHATGGHVHIEFNRDARGNSYCDQLM